MSTLNLMMKTLDGFALLTLFNPQLPVQTKTSSQAKAKAFRNHSGRAAKAFGPSGEANSSEASSTQALRSAPANAASHVGLHHRCPQHQSHNVQLHCGHFSPSKLILTFLHHDHCNRRLTTINFCSRVQSETCDKEGEADGPNAATYQHLRTRTARASKEAAAEPQIPLRYEVRERGFHLWLVSPEIDD